MTHGFIEHERHARTWMWIVDKATAGSYAHRHRAELESLAMRYMCIAVEFEIKTRHIRSLYKHGKVD